MKKLLTIAAATTVLGAGVYAEPAKALNIPEAEFSACRHEFVSSFRTARTRIGGTIPGNLSQIAGDYCNVAVLAVFSGDKMSDAVQMGLEAVKNKYGNF